MGRGIVGGSGVGTVGRRRGLGHLYVLTVSGARLRELARHRGRFAVAVVMR